MKLINNNKIKYKFYYAIFRVKNLNFLKIKLNYVSKLNFSLKKYFINRFG